MAPLPESKKKKFGAILGKISIWGAFLRQFRFVEPETLFASPEYEKPLSPPCHLLPRLVIVMNDPASVSGNGQGVEAFVFVLIFLPLVI